MRFILFVLFLLWATPLQAQAPADSVLASLGREMARVLLQEVRAAFPRTDSLTASLAPMHPELTKPLQRDFVAPLGPLLPWSSPVWRQRVVVFWPEFSADTAALAVHFIHRTPCPRDGRSSFTWNQEDQRFRYQFIQHQGRWHFLGSDPGVISVGDCTKEPKGIPGAPRPNIRLQGNTSRPYFQPRSRSESSALS